MARKVFISFLGSNNYLETYYSFEGKNQNNQLGLFKKI